jgi:hypothetical protein
MEETPAALASSCLPALRLLVGYALTAEEAAPGRRMLLDRAGVADGPACEALAGVLGAVRRRAAVRRTLDGVLAVALRVESQRYTRRSAPELARCWREQGDRLAGPRLAALLWQVARREERGLRELEREIARACSPLRLLSAAQLAVDLVYHSVAAERVGLDGLVHADPVEEASDAA